MSVDPRCGPTPDLCPEHGTDCMRRDFIPDPLAGKAMTARNATTMATTLAELTAEAIIERLTPWLHHDLGCRGQYGDDSLCTCGLAAALGTPT